MCLFRLILFLKSPRPSVCWFVTIFTPSCYSHMHTAQCIAHPSIPDQQCSSETGIHWGFPHMIMYAGSQCSQHCPGVNLQKYGIINVWVFTMYNGHRWYHDASRRCQKLSDVSDRIPCQMASDTSILSTTSLLWKIFQVWPTLLD